MKQYFTEQEVQEFKDGSINYPFITFDKKEDEVLEVSEVTSIGGMATNNGTPTRITVRVHRKGELDKLLTYTLDNEEVLPTTTFNTNQEMTQGSIEWLASQIMDNWNDITAGARDIAEFIDKAKAMHKDEIENAVKQGWDYNEEGLVQWMGEKYYTETFVSNVSELVCTQCGGKKDIKFSAMKNFQAYCEDCRDE